MSRENIETARRLFQAVKERDVSGVLAAYAPEITIRDSVSLPYGGVHRGLEGAKQHIEVAAQTWNHLQSDAERKMDAVFIDGGEYVVVLWHLKGWEASTNRRLDLPVTSVYKMEDGKIAESQMYYSDTATIEQFLAGKTDTYSL